MAELFGHSWTTQNGSKPGELWIDFVSRIDVMVLKTAITLITQSGKTFPPHLPEFIAICKTAAGIPDAETALEHAANRRWTHPCVYETASRIGHFEIRNSSQKSLLPRWTRVYDQVSGEYLFGSRFQPPVRQSIQSTRPAPASREFVLETLDKIIGSLKA